LANHINGDLRVALGLLDQKASWPAAASRAVAELALACTRMHEESRPNFADIVRGVRTITEMEIAEPAPAPSPSAGAAARASPPRNAGIYAITATKTPEPRHVVPNVSPNAAVGGAVTPQLPGPAFQPNAAKRGVSPANARSPHSKAPPQLDGRPSAPVAGSVQAAASQATGVELFALECSYAEGTDLQEVPHEKRRIVHRSDAEEGSLTDAVQQGPLSVGRAFQTSLFEELVAKGASRSTISREHFQVWVEAPSSSSSKAQAGDTGDAPYSFCNFVLANCSGNGTRVNDNLLQGRGEQAFLRHGDQITLARSAPLATDSASQAEFVQFRFDLSRSCFREVLDKSRQLGSRVRSSSRFATVKAGVHDFESKDTDAHGKGRARSSPSPQTTPQTPLKTPKTPSVQSWREGDPVFFLEICGPGVQAKVPAERRRFAFAPSPDGDGQELYSSLIIGRAHQLEFWQEVLQPDALSTLSRQHFEVQTWRSVSSDGCFSFLARNLSDVNSVHVLGRTEGAVEEQPMALERGEQRHLLDGDRLVLNLGQSHNFWLAFNDLTSSTSLGVEDSELLHNTDSIAARSRSALRGQGSSKSSSTVASSNRFESSRFRPRSSRSPWQHKDEDDISTAATPHDLHPEEEAEDEDVGAGRYLLKAGPSLSFSSQPPKGGFNNQPFTEVAPWARARSSTSATTIAGWRPMTGSASGSEGEASHQNSGPIEKRRTSSQPKNALNGRGGYPMAPSLSPVRRSLKAEGGAHEGHRRAVSPGPGLVDTRADPQVKNDKSPGRVRAEATIPWRI